MDWKGCYTALVTPFLDGKVDWAALEKIVEGQVAGGVAGLVPVGTTGESPSLDYEEHLEVIKFVTKHAAGRCKIIAGTGANSTREAVMLTQRVADIGIDATLQVTPYYNKPTQEGIFRHMVEVADKGGMPVILYNVPGRSGVEIAVDTVGRLSQHENVVAIKEASGSVERVSQIGDVCDLPVLSGDDTITLPMLSVGACGVISVVSNVIPAEVNQMVNLMLEGKYLEATAIHRKYYPFFRDLFLETNPIPVKAALAMRGEIQEEYRLPMCEMSPGNRAKLEASMKACGLL